MVKVNFYTTSSPNIQVNKNLTNSITKNLNFKDNVDVVNPSIITEIDIECNYAYIANFKRYYYVSKTILTGSRYRYDFKCDVLMSYKNDIKNIKCTVVRNEFYSNCNGYLADQKYVSLVYKQYVTKLFPTGMHADALILNTLG